MYDLSLILPTCGDPLVLYIWFQNYKKIQHLIDDIVISVDFNAHVKNGSSEIDPVKIKHRNEEYNSFIKFHTNLFREYNVKNYIFTYGSQHGINLRHLLLKFKSELNPNILIMEEDDYIVNIKSFTDQLKCFMDMEYDIIAPKLSLSVSQSWDTFFINALKSMHIDIDNYDDKPFSYWPTNFIIKKDHIFSTDLHFEAKTYYKYDKFQINNQTYIIENDFSLDTFRHFTFQTLMNTHIRKILLKNSSLRGNLSEACIVDNISEYMDYHLSGTSTFFANRFWEDSYNENGPYALTEYNTRNIDNISIPLIDYYRTAKILYSILLQFDNSNFIFYDNYKRNIEIFITSCECRVMSWIKNMNSDKKYGIYMPFINTLIPHII